MDSDATVWSLLCEIGRKLWTLCVELAIMAITLVGAYVCLRWVWQRLMP